MWFWYATGSALFSGLSVILNRYSLGKNRTALLTWALFSLPLPILGYLAFKNGTPRVTPIFLLTEATSAILFALAKPISMLPLKKKEISHIYPLTFFNSFFAYVYGLVILSERLKIIPIAGLLLVILGGYALKVVEVKEGLLKPFKLMINDRSSFFILASTAIMPITSILDKIAIQNVYPTNQVFVLFFGNLIMSLIVSVYLIKQQRGTWISDLGKNFVGLFVNSLIYTGVSLLYLYAVTSGAVALVSAVKKLEVVIVLCLGWLLFKDKPSKAVWSGTVIMLLGVLLIKFGTL